MQILFFKLAKYITEENRFGMRTWYELPSHILTTAAYISSRGYQHVSVENRFPGDIPDFSKYDVVVEWVSIADGLYEGLFYLSLAKAAGCKTVLMLFDDWQGIQKEIMQDYAQLDYAIHGYDREIVLERLLNGLERKDLPASRSGLLYRRNNEVIDEGLSSEAQSLEHLVSCRTWIEHLNPKAYAQYFMRASAGCPFTCTFCHIGKRKAMFRKPADLVDELKALARNSYVRIGSADMLANPTWARHFSELLLRDNVCVRWETDARADMVKDESLLKIMRDSGCSEIAIGIESFHPKIISAIQKNIKLDEVYAGIERLLSAGITPTLNMMLGHPLDSDETLSVTRDTLATLLKKGAKLVGFQFLRPLPGTAIEEECLNLGLLEKRLSYKEWFQSRHEPVMPTKYLSKDKLVEWMSKMNKTCEPAVARSCAHPKKPRSLQDFKLFFIKSRQKLNEPRKKKEITKENNASHTLREVISIGPHNILLYKHMLQELKNDASVNFITSHEFFARQYNPAVLNILLRHDIDFRPKKLSLLVELELELGLSSDIYVILDKSVYDISPHIDYLRTLRDRGFVVGLHTLAPGNDDYYGIFYSELKQFENIFGFPAQYFTIHGKSPHPLHWAQKRQTFIEGIKNIMDSVALKGSHNIQPPDYWVEDSGINLSPFSIVRKEFLRIREIRANGVVGILTHPMHWSQGDVAWPVSEEATIEHLKKLL